MKIFFEPSITPKARFCFCHHDDPLEGTEIRQHGGGKDATYHPDDIDLIAYNCGWLIGEKASYIEKHLKSCHTCQDLYEELAEQDEDGLIIELSDGKLDRDGFSALLKKIDKEKPLGSST